MDIIITYSIYSDVLNNKEQQNYKLLWYTTDSIYYSTMPNKIPMRLSKNFKNWLIFPPAYGDVDQHLRISDECARVANIELRQGRV